MKSHPLSVSHLVFGLVFLGVAASWALHAAKLVDTSQVELLLPLSLVVAGVIGLVAFAARGLSRRGHGGVAAAGSATEAPESWDPEDTEDTVVTTYRHDEMTRPLETDSDDDTRTYPTTQGDLR